jgi:mRNA interferase HigB
MRIIAKRTLREYWEKHANCRKELAEWYSIACKSDWTTPKEVKQTFPKCSVIGNNRIVFDIVGGNFRLIVKFSYRMKIGYIRFIGTHKEYDKIDAKVF